MSLFTQSQCTAEIVRLHDFFQEWFRGEVEATDEEFSRFAAVMDEKFAIVGPGGQLTELPALTTGLRNAHGQQPEIRIWTENHQLRWQTETVTLFTYEEWQESAAGTTTRLSSVLFQHDPEALHGLCWLHVHETWIATP